jgi:hypothetical protein
MLYQIASSSARASAATDAPLPRHFALLGGKTRPAAPLHVFRQLAHGFPGDFDTLAAGSRGLRDIDGRKNSLRRRSRSSHSAKASFAASSGLSMRPASMASRMKASWSGVGRISMRIG